jgi:exonuclease III
MFVVNRHFRTDELRVMTINVNSLSDFKLNVYLDFAIFAKMDIVVLIDTCHSIKNSQSLSHYANFYINRQSSDSWRVSVSCPLHTTATHLHGGVMLLYSSRISKVSFKEIIPGGFLSKLHFTFGFQTITLFPTYWPCKHETTDSDVGNHCWNQILRYSKGIDPITYIKCLLTDHIQQAVLQHSEVIVSGDFNSDITRPGKDGHHLQQFISDTSLKNASTGDAATSISFISHTYNPNQHSRIDYALYKGNNIESSCCSPVNLDFQKGDHIPIIAVFRLTGEMVYFPKKTRRSLYGLPNRNDKKLQDAIETLCNTQLTIYPDETAEQFITRADLQSAEVMRQSMTNRNSSRNPNGFSVVAKVIINHLKFIVRIKQHLQGLHHRSLSGPRPHSLGADAC